MKKNLRILILCIAVFLTACSGVATPTQVQPTNNIEPTLDSVKTEAAGTAVAAITVQPTATELPPTSTTAPSATPVPSATLAPTDTSLPVTNTSTAVSTLKPTVVITLTPIEAGCRITASSISGPDVKPAGGDFDARWTVKNTGSSTWVKGTTDYRYSSGTKMQKNVDAYDINSDVAASASIDLVVDMVAPTKPGVYQATWIVAQGGTVLCSLPVAITVQ